MSARVFAMSFASLYPLYLQKVEKKGRTKEELDAAILWLTGYSPEGLAALIAERKDLRAFFDEAPALNPHIGKVTGVVCGVRVEAIEDPLMQKIRVLDKLVDELARGRPLQKVLRSA